VVPGGVWVGSDARSQRKGFTRVDASLREYVVDEGGRVTGFGLNAVRALIARGRMLWAGTDVGVIRFEPGGRPDRLDTGAGLPDADVYALAQSAAGVWVGTALGLALIGENGGVTQVDRVLQEPVLSVSASRDWAWVGTTSGLYLATAADRRITMPAEARSVPGLTGATVAITRSADTVIAASVDQIFWRAPGGTWTAEPVIANRIGPVYAVEGDSAGVWVGGARGFAFFRFATRSFHVYAAPGDLPGAVRDLAVSGDYLWIATEAGLVRFERRVLYP
jgi:ligand-binding sensor domain-containing protein